MLAIGLLLFMCDSNTPILAWIFLGLMFMLAALLLYSGIISKNFYYDRYNLYIKGHKETKKVKFEKITRIKASLIRLSFTWSENRLYVIEYIDLSGENCEADLWVPTWSNNMSRFISAVEKINKDVVIQLTPQ